MSIALVVPSYGRPLDLERCLTSALAQTVSFDEIIVASRSDDRATARRLAKRTDVVRVAVKEVGVLAAMRAGVAQTSCDLVTFTDDDAVLPPDYVERVLAHFAQRPEIAGVGGRDVLFDGPDRPRPTALTTKVGTISAWGRHVGNHHCGTGAPRYVAMLKGVNATYRRELLPLPEGLRGVGAQPHFELSLGQHLQQQGYALLYDPSLTVDHYPAPRLDGDQRSAPSEQAVSDSAYNAQRAMPARLQTRRLLYVLLVGDAATPGVLRCAVALVRGQGGVLARRRASWQGTLDAWRQRHTPQSFTRF